MGEVVLKKETVNIAVGDGDFVSIDADVSGVPGLVVHRQQKYSQKDGGDRRSTSIWQITHVGSGRGVFPAGTGLTTRHEAIALCEDMGKMGDWSKEHPPIETHNIAKLRKVIEAARQSSTGKKEEGDLEKALKSAADSGLKIRRIKKDGEKHYAVLDATGTELAVFRHAGQASAFLRERG